MAVVRRQAPNRGKKITLQRSGSKKSQNKRREVKRKREKRTLYVPWRGIGNFFSIAGITTFCLIVIGTLSFSLIYGYRYITSNSYFQLKTIAIQGNTKLSSREILEIAGLEEGGNLLALSIDSVEERLAANPWVKTVSVARVLPETLQVTIMEKDPAFWLLHNGTLYYADAKGKLIAPLDANKLASLPTLEVEAGAEDATDALPDLVKSLRVAQIPLDMSKITIVRLSAARGVEIFVEGSHLKITVGLEDWLANLHRLGRTIEDLQHRTELAKVRSIRAQGANVWVETIGKAVNG